MEHLKASFELTKEFVDELLPELYSIIVDKLQIPRIGWWWKKEKDDDGKTLLLDGWDYYMEGNEDDDKYIAFLLARRDKTKIDLKCTAKHSNRYYGGPWIDDYKTLDDEFLERVIKDWGVPHASLIMDYTELFQSTKGVPVRRKERA